MMKTARTMTCSVCHDTGHNKRSCIRRNCHDIVEDLISSAVQNTGPKFPLQNEALQKETEALKATIEDLGRDMAEKDETIQKLQTALANIVENLRAALEEQEAKEEAARKDARIEEFMEWQMDLCMQYKAKKITHAQGMRMMRELYPEFTPDDKEGEDSFTDKEWEQKHDWDNLDFGTAEEPLCGLCGCRSDNGMWDEDGDMTEDVICDECNERWCYDEDRDAYVLREELTKPKKPLDMSAILENARKIPLCK